MTPMILTSRLDLAVGRRFEGVKTPEYLLLLDRVVLHIMGDLASIIMPRHLPDKLIIVGDKIKHLASPVTIVQSPDFRLAGGRAIEPIHTCFERPRPCDTQGA